MQPKWAILLVLFLLFPCLGHADPGPYDGTNFKGRIAFSSDGNANDEDDWGAFPVAAAILDAFGVMDKLVHVDYNNILPQNDPRFYREMTESVLGSVERWGLPKETLFDCQTELEQAIESIKNAINASSAEDPLYYVLAGPMEVPYRGIMRADPEKRKFVYCISHSGWNDGFTSSQHQYMHPHNKRDVIPLGINWIQIKDGNPNLAHPGGPGKRSTPEEWSLYHWLRDSADQRLGWIFTRLEAEWRADISDATMTYFLLTGDEDADLGKLKRLLDEKQVPKPVGARKVIRLEAENFRNLENFALDFRNNRALSKRICVNLDGNGDGRIQTPFDEPYSADRARYDVEVRYNGAPDSECEFALAVNGTRVGESWRANSGEAGWRSHTIPGVTIATGDEITVEVRGGGGEVGGLDYVELRTGYGSTNGNQ